MNLRKAAVRSGVIILIAALSVAFGFLIQSISDKSDRKKYPRPDEYAGFVSAYSREYGVPEYVVYSVIKVESDFQSGLERDGKIGLMQISPEVFEKYGAELNETSGVGILYDPETNIKYGTYRLSRLKYDLGTWKSVFAALYSGEETVAGWLADTAYSDMAEDGNNAKLRDIPDAGCAAFTENVMKIEETYKKLYYTD